jgi:hypothetical protein
MRSSWNFWLNLIICTDASFFLFFVSSVLQVPFLNLMANLQQRSGEVQIRVGGNTQDTAVLVASTPDGKILEKDTSGVSNPVSYLSVPIKNKIK